MPTSTAATPGSVSVVTHDDLLAAERTALQCLNTITAVWFAACGPPIRQLLSDKIDGDKKGDQARVFMEVINRCLDCLERAVPEWETIPDEVWNAIEQATVSRRTELVLAYGMTATTAHVLVGRQARFVLAFLTSASRDGGCMEVSVPADASDLEEQVALASYVAEFFGSRAKHGLDPEVLTALIAQEHCWAVTDIGDAAGEGEDPKDLTRMRVASERFFVSRPTWPRAWH